MDTTYKLVQRVVNFILTAMETRLMFQKGNYAINNKQMKTDFNHSKFQIFLNLLNQILCKQRTKSTTSSS